MTTAVNTVVVGGGQAGLAVSYYLNRRSQDHVVLEQADRPGSAWRSHRWDSFTLNTPRWQSRLPGVQYAEYDPDGFMSRNEVVAYFEEFARRLPVRYGMRVTRIDATEKAVNISFGSRIASRSGRAMSSWPRASINAEDPRSKPQFSIPHQAASFRRLPQSRPAHIRRCAGGWKRTIGCPDRRRAL